MAISERATHRKNPMNQLTRGHTKYLAALIGLGVLAASATAQPAVTNPSDPAAYEYRLLATQRTSTMEKEMNETAAQGFRLAEVMGGNTAAGGEEIVVVMQRELPAGDAAEAQPRMRYKLLAASKTSTMEKELREAGDEGFEYRGQTVYDSAFGGREVAVILELDANAPSRRIEYRLLATNKTSTMEKELNQVGGGGFRIVGMTVAKTAFGGEEIVSILQRELE